MVTLLYYLFCAFIGVLLIWNFFEEDNTYNEILYAFVLIPFVLRVLRIY